MNLTYTNLCIIYKLFNFYSSIISLINFEIYLLNRIEMNSDWI